MLGTEDLRSIIQSGLVQSDRARRVSGGGVAVGEVASALQGARVFSTEYPLQPGQGCLVRGEGVCHLAG